MCFVLMRQFSLVPFPVGSISSRITHSFTCWVSNKPNNWFFPEYCLLPLDLCTGRFPWLNSFHHWYTDVHKTHHWPNESETVSISHSSLHLHLTHSSSIFHTPSLLVLSIPHKAFTDGPSLATGAPSHLVHMSVITLPHGIPQQNVNSSRANTTVLSSLSPETSTQWQVISKCLSEEGRKTKRAAGEKGMNITPSEFLTRQVSGYEEPLEPLLCLAYQEHSPLYGCGMGLAAARRWAERRSKKIWD